MRIHTNQSRRTFLRRTAQLSAAGVAAPLAGSFGLIGEAAAATADDYKALVCVFLYGGNDYANTLPPYDQSSYDLYYNARPALALDRSSLAGTALSPANDLGGRQYALNPALAPLMQLFGSGKLAVLLNVGTLVQPTTKIQYQARTVQLPPKLFSHNDQESYFQASGAEGAPTGWGGRIGDLVEASNGNASLTCINASGQAVFLSGRYAQPYTVALSGPPALLNGSQRIGGSATAASALQQIITSSGGRMFAQEYAKVAVRALEIGGTVSTALANAPENYFTLFPRDSPLAAQLKIVARMIAVSAELGMKRQVFFVSLGGWDMHDGLPTRHPALLGQLAQAMKAFYDTTVQLGVADKVTSFTASDFGRSLVGNDDGSDHGWGSMHFVLGGAVQGQRIYGTPPDVGADTNDDVDSGRLIPTTSVDQYAATLASWFGVAPGDLTTVMPNLQNFNPSSWNLGFV
jgi:uncharacterized protein (DUF1501 family)